MTRKEKAGFVAEKLTELYPKTTIPLDHTDPYTLLVAVVLSAQCTDKKVNEITPLLFAKARNPQQMMKLSVEEIQDIIRPCGLSPMKSKGIHGLSRIILWRSTVARYPPNMEALERYARRGPQDGQRGDGASLRGAGLSGGYPHPPAGLWRWTLSTGKSVEHTEADLKKLFPKGRGTTCTCDHLLRSGILSGEGPRSSQPAPSASIIGGRSLFVSPPAFSP
jgi:endonuclease-3